MKQESAIGYLLEPFVHFAHDFDHHSETLLNNAMCTTLCPCYNVISYETASNGVEI